jgi:GTP-binding protein EngB required for normal cell division
MQRFDFEVRTENNDLITGVGVRPKPPLEGADDSYEGFSTCEELFAPISPPHGKTFEHKSDGTRRTDTFDGYPVTSREQKPHETLNPFQANRLRVTCQHIDKLLSEIEQILNTTTSKAAFPRYAPDILPAQRRTVEDYIARVRAQLTRILEGQGTRREKASIPASRAVHSHLGAIHIAVEELKPKYMRGYGEVPESVATELNGIVGELGGLIQRFDRYLSEGTGEDLRTRLERLESSANDLQLLKKIEQTVRDCGLVELRPSIAAILDRVEDKTFEIAVFGRVSSGKSSLLNAILETEALPVGVTPITAVPTRIVHAEQPSLTVWFSEMPSKRFDISHLPEFATEQDNPGNAKHVVRLVLSLPAPRLRGALSFLDTPGLGSLATSGARETLAYLPKCDLGVVLIDAGSTLSADDLQTILALQEAAVPVNILLSKADLVSQEDRSRVVRYIQENILAECRLDVPIHPVSVLPSCRATLNGWFEEQIVPLCARAQELRAASLRRKIGALRDSVAACLEARIRRSTQSSTQERAQAAEARLRATTGKIEEIRSLCLGVVQSEATGAERRKAPELAEEAAKTLLDAWRGNSYGVIGPDRIVRDSITEFIHVQTGKLQAQVTSLAEQLGVDLRQCAAELKLSDMPSSGEFESSLRGSPLFECPSFGIGVARPLAASLFGERVSIRWVARKISRQLPPSLYTALESYWSLVAEWLNATISDLQQKFEAYAENYRAQAEQTLNGRELTKEQLAGMRESLRQLKPDAAEGEPRIAGATGPIPTPEEETV